MRYPSRAICAQRCTYARCCHDIARDNNGDLYSEIRLEIIVLRLKSFSIQTEPKYSAKFGYLRKDRTLHYYFLFVNKT